MSFGSRSGWRSPTTAWPERSRFASSPDGFWTRTTTSADLYSSSVETIVAPASVKALSGIRAPRPAPDSTTISAPACCSLARESGTRATRRSPGAVSRATPILMGAARIAGSEGPADGHDHERQHVQMAERGPRDRARPPVEPGEDRAADERRPQLEVGLPDVGEDE